MLSFRKKKKKQKWKKAWIRAVPQHSGCMKGDNKTEWLYDIGYRILVKIARFRGRRAIWRKANNRTNTSTKIMEIK